MAVIQQKTITVFLVFLISTVAMAQEGIKLWTGHSVRARLDKEWRLTAGQLFLFGQEPFGLSSLQNSVNLRYRMSRRMYVDAGYIRSSDPLDPDQEARNRLSSRFRLNSRLGKFRFANSLRAEWHFPERSKFEYRLRYRFRVHRGNWGLPLRITPFVANEFQYYLSGRPLQYRDEAGERLVRQSPNGLHAHRITLGASFRPFKNANASLSYIRQTEFNLGNKYREINVTDPRDGRILRRFNDFSVLMFRFSYQLDLRPRSPSSASSGSSNSKNRSAGSR